MLIAIFTLFFFFFVYSFSYNEFYTTFTYISL